MDVNLGTWIAPYMKKGMKSIRKVSESVKLKSLNEHLLTKLSAVDNNPRINTITRSNQPALSEKSKR